MSNYLVRGGAVQSHNPLLLRARVQARLLWEIGAEGAEVRELRSRLGLDSAYVSRLLRSLEGQGLIVVGTSSNDERVRHVQLTEAGLRERAELDHRACGRTISMPLLPISWP